MDGCQDTLQNQYWYQDGSMDGWLLSTSCDYFVESPNGSTGTVSPTSTPYLCGVKMKKARRMEGFSSSILGFYSSGSKGILGPRAYYKTVGLLWRIQKSRRIWTPHSYVHQ